MPAHEELEVTLGEAVRVLRVQQRLTQSELSEIANVSLSALKNLESGRGSTTSTLLKVIHALGRDEWVGTLAPEVTFNPLDLIGYRTTARSRSPRRVRRSDAT